QRRRSAQVDPVADAHRSADGRLLVDSPRSRGTACDWPATRASLATATVDAATDAHVLHERLLQGDAAHLARWQGHGYRCLQPKLDALLARLPAVAQRRFANPGLGHTYLGT